MGVLNHIYVAATGVAITGEAIDALTRVNRSLDALLDTKCLTATRSRTAQTSPRGGRSTMET